MKFSANLGFLWRELPLPDAIRAAARAGFDAVECHWPYGEDQTEVAAALRQTGLEMLCLNTAPGDLDAGEFGLSALPGREEEARQHIDRALDYARALSTRRVHVMAGKAEGAAAQATFCDNLRYACDQAARDGVSILIEPLNPHDVPGYFLRSTDQAVALMDTLGADNLKLMFDCYHIQRSEGSVCTRLQRLLPRIGHIQIASAPDRGAPDHGDLSYREVFDLLRRLGYDQPLGAEYQPAGPVEDSLGWLQDRHG